MPTNSDVNVTYNKTSFNTSESSDIEGFMKVKNFTENSSGISTPQFEIKKQITNDELTDSSVTTTKIVDHSVTRNKLTTNVRTLQLNDTFEESVLAMTEETINTIPLATSVSDLGQILVTWYLANVTSENAEEVARQLSIQYFIWHNETDDTNNLTYKITATKLTYDLTLYFQIWEIV